VAVNGCMIHESLVLLLNAAGWSEGVIVKLGCAGKVDRLARLWASPA
jgi:hypothetical protein